MATGKTNAQWVRVWVDDEVPTLRDISASCSSVELPWTVESSDVTGFSDGVINVTVGRPDTPVTMSGPFSNTADVGAHDVLSVIVTQATPTVTLKIQVGILAAPSGTDPEYLGEFHCTEYSVDLSSMTWNATFLKSGSSAPVWGTYT